MNFHTQELHLLTQSTVVFVKEGDDYHDECDDDDTMMLESASWSYDWAAMGLCFDEDREQIQYCVYTLCQSEQKVKG